MSAKRGAPHGVESPNGAREKKNMEYVQYSTWEREKQ